jgi:phage baseplate assembly protein W
MTSDAHLRTDLRLQLRQAALRPVYGSQELVRRLPQGRVTDFATIQGQDNLAQAVVVRLLTPRGELAALGHPEYGSRLHELIGRLNVETNLDLIRLYILESLTQEPRLEAVERLEVTPAPGTRDRINISLLVKPVAAPVTPISFVLEVAP